MGCRRRSLVVTALLGLALAPVPAAALPYVYVTDPANSSLYTIDAATNTIVRQISVLGGAGAVAVSPDGTRAYVAEYSAGAIAVIDTSRIGNPSLNPVISTLAVGGNPVDLALGPAGRDLFVADAASATVEQFDLNTVVPASPVAVATYGPDSGLVAMALAPDGEALALASTATDQVTLYNFRHLVNGAPAPATIALPATPAAIAFADDGAMLWIATASGFSRYDRATGKVTNDTLSGGTDAVAYAARGPDLYFGAGTGNVVYAYDPVANTRAAINIAGPPSGLAVSPDGTRVYAVQNCTGCGVAVIATSGDQYLQSVTFGQGPATGGRFAGPGYITAANSVTSGAAGQQLSGNLGAVDSQQRALTYALIMPPAAGQLVLDPSGSFVYTPPSALSGVESFVWQATAAGGPGSPTNPASRPVTESLVITPTLSAIAAQTAMAGATVGPLSFSVDGSTPLAIAVTSSNSAVIDATQAMVTPGCGTSVLDCTLTLHAGTAAGQSATVTVTATDPQFLDAKQTFDVTIRSNQSGGGGGGISWLGLSALAAVLLVVKRFARGGAKS